MCDQIQVSISSKNFQSIPFQLYEKDFTFFVNNIPFQTNRIFADMLSPIVQKMHYSDTTLNKLYITVKCPDYFEDFLKLAQKQNDEIDLNIAIIFSEYFEALGNVNEAIKIRSDYFSEVNVDNIIERIEYVNELAKNGQYEAYNDESSIRQLISYAASHFYEIGKAKFEKLPKDTIEEILNDSSFKTYDEDSLLDFILHLYDMDHSYSNLFEYVLFSNVSNELFRLFISEFDVQFINHSIWLSVCSKFLPNNKCSGKSCKGRYKFEEGDECLYCTDYYNNLNAKRILSSSDDNEYIDDDLEDNNDEGDFDDNNDFDNDDNDNENDDNDNDDDNDDDNGNDNDDDNGNGNDNGNDDDNGNDNDDNNGNDNNDNNGNDNNDNDDNNGNDNNDNNGNDNDDNNGNDNNDNDNENGDNDDNENGRNDNDNENNNNNENDDEDDDDDFSSGYKSSSSLRLSRENSGPTSLFRMVCNEFKRSGAPPEWNSTKIIMILYSIADQMSQLYKYQIPHHHLIPHFISLNEDLEPYCDLLLADDDYELVNEYDTHYSNFMPSEYLTDGAQFKINEKSEVYTFSTIAFMCFTGSYPFQGKKQMVIIDLIKRDFREQIPDEIPENIKNLISICWDQNLENRPSFDEIKQMLSDTTSYDESIDINEFETFLSQYNDVDDDDEAK